MLLCLYGQSRAEAMYRSAWPTYCAALWSSQSSWPKVDYRTPQQQRRRVRGGPREGWREGYTKRARHRGRKRRKKRWCSLLFSFVSLESFPLPPLEETAAPTTQTSINTTSLWKVSLISSFVQLQWTFCLKNPVLRASHEWFLNLCFLLLSLVGKRSHIVFSLIFILCLLKLESGLDPSSMILTSRFCPSLVSCLTISGSLVDKWRSGCARNGFQAHYVKKE